MVTFAISGHRRRIRLIVHGAALLLWALLGAALLAAWAGSPQDPPLARGVLWALAGAALLWNSRRKGAGRETLTVTPTQLVVRRAVGPFRLRRRYALSRVRRARLATPAPERFRIEFDYDGRTRRFGRNLTALEADCIVSMIRRAATPPGWPS